MDTAAGIDPDLLIKRDDGDVVRFEKSQTVFQIVRLRLHLNQQTPFLFAGDGGP